MLTAEDLERQKEHFAKRTVQFTSLGYDRFAAASFIIDQGGVLEGPALDIGTGMGITARELARRGLDVVTIDTNADDQRVASFLTDDPVLANRLTFTLADAAALPFPDGHFGCAVAVDVLHHLESGGSVLAELVRVVKPGGAVVLGDFTVEGFALVSKVHAGEGRIHPEGPVTVDWACGFLCALGLTERHVAGGHMHDVRVLRTPHHADLPDGQ